MKALREMVVLVAGGAGAVGEGIVKRFLEAGANVIVPSPSNEKLEVLTDGFAAYKDKLTLVKTNIGIESDIALLRDSILQKFGRLDVIVASLGGWWQGLPIVNLPLETWNEILNSNLTSHFLVAKSFMPILLHQNAGSYIFIAGQGGAVTPVPQAIPVSVAVAGEIMLAKGFSAENKNYQVQINTLVLGVVNTRERRSYSQPDWITSEDVGEFAVKLTSPSNQHITGEAISLLDKKTLAKQLSRLV
jgi:NAD(P)-dependent dehydrogenase (short-subunit alcohol dehydrogenase family)